MADDPFKLIHTNDFEGRIEQTSLEDHPDVALALGRYMATFSTFEQELYLAFHRVLNTPYQGVMKLLGHIQSFTMKLEAVEGFVSYSILNEDERKDAQTVFGIARAANSFRNRVVHGQFGIKEEDRTLVLVPWSTSSSRKSAPEPISAKRIDDYRDMDLRRGLFVVDLFVKRQPLPPPPFRREPSIVPEPSTE